MNTTMTSEAPAICKISYYRRGHGWGGVIKVDGVEVWRCDHHHKNRDQTTKFSGQAAQECAKAEALRRGLRWWL